MRIWFAHNHKNATGILSSNGGHGYHHPRPMHQGTPVLKRRNGRTVGHNYYTPSPDSVTVFLTTALAIKEHILLSWMYVHLLFVHALHSIRKKNKRQDGLKVTHLPIPFLEMVAADMQIPVLCQSPLFFWFWWSLWLAIVFNTWRNTEEYDSSSWM